MAPYDYNTLIVVMMQLATNNNVLEVQITFYTASN